MVVFCGGALYAGPLEKAVMSRLETTEYDAVDMAIVFESVTHKHRLLSINADRHHVPASLMKLILTGATFDRLSPRYVFKTPVYINKATIPSVFIKGVGDPSLTMDHVAEIVRLLKKRGIKTIQDIVLDDSFIRRDVNKFGNNARYYYALAAGINLNFNQLNGVVDVAGKSVKWLPETSYAKFNTTRMIVSDQPNKAGYPAVNFLQKPMYDRFFIAGEVTLKDEHNKNLNMRVSRPVLFFGRALQDLCQAEGISIAGNVKRKVFHKKGKRLIGKLKSLSLSEVVKVLNHDSNNMVASCLLKDLGALHDSVPGTTKKGLKVLYRYGKQRLNIDPNDWQLKDGSGLSVLNQVTSSQMNDVLLGLYAKKKTRRLIQKVLVNPQAYEDYHYLTVPDQMEVYFKTGTLGRRGVSNLAGYVFLKDTNEVYSFVIMAQRKIQNKKIYKGAYTMPILQDILEELSKSKADVAFSH